MPLYKPRTPSCLIIFLTKDVKRKENESYVNVCPGRASVTVFSLNHYQEGHTTIPCRRVFIRHGIHACDLHATTEHIQRVRHGLSKTSREGSTDQFHSNSGRSLSWRCQTGAQDLVCLEIESYIGCNTLRVMNSYHCMVSHRHSKLRYAHGCYYFAGVRLTVSVGPSPR